MACAAETSVATTHGTWFARLAHMRESKDDPAKKASDDGDNELEIEVELEDDESEYPDEDDIEDIDLDDLAAMEGPDA